MGANTSKSSSHPQQKLADDFDFGSLLPNGLYPSTELDLRPIQSLIRARKLAPFYKGLADAPEPVAAVAAPVPQASSSSLSTSSAQPSAGNGRARSASSSRVEGVDRSRDHQRIKERLYNDAVECPICFLYYPANTNYSRCCDYPICTECFVQIHRPSEAPTQSATCPFCQVENYGVIYSPPVWNRREALNQESSTKQAPAGSGAQHTTSGIATNSAKPRRKSVGHKDSKVVLVDHVRPNWKKELATNSPSARATSRRNSASAGQSRNRLRLPLRDRSASSAATTDRQQFGEYRDMNVELEEWMMMEAIRLSLAEHEEEQRRRNAESNAAQQAPASGQATAPTDGNNESTVEQDDDDDDDDNKPLATALGLHRIQQRNPISTVTPSSSTPSSSSTSESDSSQPPTGSSPDSPSSDDAVVGGTSDRKPSSLDDDGETIPQRLVC